MHLLSEFSILTEDLGVIYGNSEIKQNAPAEEEGKFFKGIRETSQSQKFAAVAIHMDITMFRTDIAIDTILTSSTRSL